MIRIRLVVALLAIAASQSCTPAAPTLPAPTGPHSVGRVSLHWVDAHRPETASDTADAKRELMVYIWYPAANAGTVWAPYLPGVERLANSPAVAPLSKLFGPSWPSIASGQLRSHSIDGAPVAAGARWPILVFSPGGGVTLFAYATQMEELASQGYVVVGAEFTYDSPGVVFPDGRVVTAADEFWSRLRREAGDAEGFDRRVVDMQAADLMFVIDKLKDLEADASSTFSSRLDLTRIGVFGHSRGGRTAARVCQLDRRVKACLSQDGNLSWRPFSLDQNGRSMEQPFMMLDHLDPELPDDVFAKMGTTRERYVQNRSARQSEAREKIYATIAGGSYHVTIVTPGISHNSFLDIRLLGRADAGTINLWPKDVQAATPHARILGLITSFSRAFFDKHVRGLPGSIADLAHASSDDVKIEQFGAVSK